MDFDGNMDASSDSSEYEFDSDLDREMDCLFNADADRSDYVFDSDLDREMDHLFPAELSGKRKALQTRRERDAKRQRTSQTGSGVAPRLEFELVQQFDPYLMPRFNRRVYKSHFRLQHNLATVDILAVGDAIDRLFRDFMSPFLTQAEAHDQVSVTVRQSSIREIFISYRKANFDIQEFANRLESLQQSQSGDSFLLTGQLDIEVAITKKISGSGRGIKSNNRNKAPVSVSDLSRIKRSIVTINNDDNACGYWAIALAKYHASGPATKDWDLVKKNRAGRLESMARLLCTTAGVEYDTPMDRDSMAKIDQSLKPEFKITVVDAANKWNRIFVGQDAPQELFIELNENHYNTITNIRGYVGSNHFCVPCFKPFSTMGEHKCTNQCTCCFGVCDSTDGRPTIKCSACKRMFNSQTCYDIHKSNSICKNKRKCDDCDIEYSGRYEHRCNQIYCDKCKNFSTGTHHCYITGKDEDKLTEEDNKSRWYLSFDIESYVDSSTGYHVPDLLISLVACDNCYDHNEKAKLGSCNDCGDGRQVFQGIDCITRFGDYLYKRLAKDAEKKKARIIAFAHNFGGYDGHFVMKDILERDYKPELVMTGSRILKMDVGNIRFLDTLSLFQQPLASLPKSFGFQNKVVKGYFPHLFNKPENFDKTFDRIPDLHFFAPEDCRTEEERQKLEEWHSRQDGAWVFWAEMIKYCDADVRVLLAALMAFRKDFKEITKLDPVSRNFTLASIGLEFFRMAFLQENTLGITPVAGYSRRINSMVATAWLSWVQARRPATLSYEHRLGPYFADGYDAASNTVYEFNGCRWHGCPRCYRNRSISITDEAGERSAESRFADYLKKKKYYMDKGFNLIEKWECDFEKERMENPDLNDFITTELEKLKELKDIGFAEIREAFYGGRTDNVKFFHEAASEERIEYKDVTSEYPFVLKFKEYPVGHPSVIVDGFDYSLQSYFGFVKCTVDPPRGLHIPVLPKRVSEKLVFPLCTACAAIGLQSECRHGRGDRSMTGTWTTAELSKAVDKGYNISRIYQVLHYERTSSDMFRGYINSWLKIKQEASGWPANVSTDNEKDQYIARYLEKEGVLLDKDKIEHNPGKRSIAKLMLNSFWGKLSQRANLPQVKVCKEYHEYWSLVENDAIELTGEFTPNRDTIVVSYQLKDDSTADPGNTSVAIAAFVTSYARLHLYKFMEQVDHIGHDRLLYFDTDSIIFVRKPGDPEIETGDYLGDLTDELPPGARCEKFVSGGPKNYGYQYRLADGTLKTVIKTKGIRHNCKTLAIFNLNVMEGIVRDFTAQAAPRVSREVRLPQLQFRSAWNAHDVRSVSSNKRYRVVSNKKWVLGNETRPFGF